MIFALYRPKGRRTASARLCRARFFVAIIAGALASGAASSWAQDTKAPASTHASRPNPPATKPQPVQGDTLDSLAVMLSEAKTGPETSLVEARMDELRRTKLTPATTLLIRRSEKDQQAGHMDDAVDDISDAMALQPDVTVLRRDRAAAALAAAHYDDAITDLGIYLHTEPNDPIAWEYLAEAEAQRKDYSAAFNAWQHLLTIAPKTDNGTKKLEQLRVHAFGKPT